MSKGDATGWKRGAGYYSRSYLKTTPAGIGKLYADGRGHGSEDRAPGKDLSARLATNLRADDNGFSGLMSSGKRPSHKQGSWKRV